MNTRVSVLVLVGLLFAGTAVADEAAKLAVIDIENAGPEGLESIQSHPAVDWWIELGDRLLIRTRSNDLDRIGSVVSVHPDADVASLAVMPNAHCADHQHDPKALPGRALVDRYGPKLLLLDDSVKSDHWQLHLSRVEPNSVVSFLSSNRLLLEEGTSDFSELVSSLTVSGYSQTLETLSSFDRLATDDILQAIDWIESELDGLGLEVVREPWSIIGGRAPNLVAYQYGSEFPDEYIVVGAHLDSRNMPFNSNQPAPGSDDNGSGSAAVLEIARQVAQYGTSRTVVYAWFTGEEQGLFGSTGFVQDNMSSDIEVVSMLNMDMISFAFDPANRGVVVGTRAGIGSGLLQTLRQAAQTYTDLNVIGTFSTCCSDHQPFLDGGIPATLSIQADGVSYPHYHETTDLFVHQTPALGVEIARMNIAALAELAGVQLSGAASFLVSPGISGYWYDPEQSGHGFQIEILADNNVVVTWYTFDGEGNQLWLIGTGTVSEDQLTVEFLRPVGGMFPPAFDPAAVVSEPWGTATFTFTSCDGGETRWQPDSETGLEAGSMPLVRLTQVDGLACE